MDCDNFFPVFLLYNGGKLNAFGWALGGDAQDPNFEHPEKPYLGVRIIFFFTEHFFNPVNRNKTYNFLKAKSLQNSLFLLGGGGA